MATEEEAAGFVHDWWTGSLTPAPVSRRDWLRVGGLGTIGLGLGLGHPAASAALHHVGPSAPETWIRLAFHAVEEAVLACFPRMPTKDRYPGPPRRALTATREWLRQPSETTRTAAAEVAKEFWTHPKIFPVGEEPPVYVALKAAHHLVCAVSAPAIPDSGHPGFPRYRAHGENEAPKSVPFAIRPECEESMRCALRSLCDVCGLQPAEAEERLRDAQVKHVVPWLLGRRDPIRERAQIPRDGVGRLRAAESAVASAPNDLKRIEELAEVCDELGWTWDGKTLGAWREQLCGDWRDWNLAKVAIDHLVALGPRAVPAALAALELQNHQTPEFGLTVLRRLGPEAQVALPRVLELLESDNQFRHQYSFSWIDFLGSVGDETAVAPLIDCLGNAQRADYACRALLRIGRPAIKPLREFLTARGPESDEPAGHYAAFALAALRAEGELVVPILARVLGEHRWSSYRRAALSGLLALGRAEDHVPQILRWLERGEQDGDQLFKPILALGVLGAVHRHPRVRPALEPFRTHQSPLLQGCAEAALQGRAYKPWCYTFCFEPYD